MLLIAAVPFVMFGLAMVFVTMLQGKFSLLIISLAGLSVVCTVCSVVIAVALFKGASSRLMIGGSLMLMLAGYVSAMVMNF